MTCSVPLVSHNGISKASSWRCGEKYRHSESSGCSPQIVYEDPHPVFSGEKQLTSLRDQTSLYLRS